MLALVIATLALLVKVATTNPGFLLKQTRPFFQHSTLFELRCGINSRSALDQKCVEVPQHCHLSRIKYCRSCFIARPSRCSHCNDCEMCVERFDHHCPWIGTCVGRRNYKYFICFILILWVLATATCIITIQYLSHLSEYSVENLWAPCILTVYSSLVLTIQVLLLVGALIIFHLYLMATSQTTHECLKSVWKNKQNQPK